MSKLIRQSVLSTLCLAVLLCAAYPMLVTGAADAFFPKEVAGSLILRDGAIEMVPPSSGSRLQREVFPSPPSAAGYNAGSSSGSNYGSHQQGAGRARPGLEQELRAERPEGVLPGEAAIKPEAALILIFLLDAAPTQVRRVAEACAQPWKRWKSSSAAMRKARNGRWWGEPKVNVLRPPGL